MESFHAKAKAVVDEMSGNHSLFYFEAGCPRKQNVYYKATETLNESVSRSEHLKESK